MTTSHSSFALSLGQYIKKRNGVPLGASGSLRNMFYRSLGARNFSVFWMYWNPIFGYYLGRFVFKPLKQYLYEPLSLLLTFTACGMVHDTVTTVVRGSLSYFFSTWFLLMGIFVIISRILKSDFSELAWILRAFINIAQVALCFFTTYFLLN